MIGGAGMMPGLPLEYPASFHEAGHAVVGFVEGFEVAHLKLATEQDGSIDGRCRTLRINLSPAEKSLPQPERRKVVLRKHGRMIEAGEGAEWHLHELTGKFFPPGGEHDWIELRNIATELAALEGTHDAAIRAEFRADASALVEKHWDAIDDLAQELRRRRFLDRNAIADCFQRNGLTLNPTETSWTTSPS